MLTKKCYHTKTLTLQNIDVPPLPLNIFNDTSPNSEMNTGMGLYIANQC